MNFDLTSDQRQLQDAAIRLSEQKLYPWLAKYPKNQPLSKAVMLQIFEVLAEFGLTGARVPEEEGGSGLSTLEYGLAFEQLPPVIALALIAHDGTTSRLCASGATKDFPQLIADLLAGRKIACTASTEPTTGSDPRSIRLRARESDDGAMHFLTGTKQWITNGTIADVAFVTGKSEKDGEFRRYIVEREVSPFHASEIPCVGLQQGHLSELTFDQVAVPRSNAIGSENSTMKTLTQAWLVNRPLLGLLGLRAAERARDVAIEHVKGREQFGALLASKQLIQEALVDIDASIQSARLLCYSALDAADRGASTQALSAMAKRQGVAVAERAASIAMRLCGAMGLATETGVEQHTRDIKMLTIPDGTYEVLTLIAGRDITGHSAL
ncbi:acyl-CoA dehydrogenase family protein [Hydrogenophaga crocea]|jgi:alkylation response protein AidB-like acyl-CoA dehydrogenase|uniref:Acyl-CoA/acyl-ACP dehydrogenase n=1 Tax=Hydrogenophaga crocea TaxID=2716225 RepID=A0A6G8IJN0_9BURK|nr:acyl-CoA dehydrogenase family protein [Hydrogenophaga crocea]QIM53190.1 acyl-CoA/acyl-ACP dehydrogenase [Hydrogenophaga crocea]